MAIPFAFALLWAQLRSPGGITARLNLAIEPRMPARVYLFKDNRPFRLSPVEAMMPLRVDMFYRERLWTNGQEPKTLEVSCNDVSHFLLLSGQGSYELPAGHYRVETYRGTFYKPASEEFDLEAGRTREVRLKMESWAGEERRLWLSGDDHIHLMRDRGDDKVFLGWLEAEDLNVANFLQLQRQADAAVQYAFGPRGEAVREGYSIRPGHESRSEFYGHVNLLGGRELIRPLSVGSMYANSPEVYPYPALLFEAGRRVGATTGYAHFNGSMPHSTLLMDLVSGSVDFVEVFQFGVLKTAEWYELLNAGFRVTGIAGSDFPVPFGRFRDWPRWLPLLGPERTLVKARPGKSAYEAWAAGVRSGNVTVTNGPLVEIEVDESGSTARASASFYRPLEKLEIVVNGVVAARVAGDGKRSRLTLSAPLPESQSCWAAARVVAAKDAGEPEIQGHTNPVYALRGGKPVMVRQAREALASRWEREIEWYRAADLVFPGEDKKQQFFRDAQAALKKLRAPLDSR